MITRGTAHLSVQFWWVRVTFLRTWAWLGPGWNGLTSGGGAHVLRFGPCVIDWRLPCLKIGASTKNTASSRRTVVRRGRGRRSSA